MLPFLDPLVYSFVPSSRSNETLKRELVAHCRDILRSQIGHSPETDFTQLAVLIKRHLLQLSPDGSSASRFTSLVMRLREQSVLTRKREAILFLFTIPTLVPPQTPTIQMPSIVFPQRTSNIALPTRTNPRREEDRSNAALLKDYRAKKGISLLHESLLVRDTLYLIQGISGKHVKFASLNEMGTRLDFSDDPNNITPPALQALVRKLAELGHLCNRVETYVRERESASHVAIIEQSLCHYLQSQLTDYYRLVATLETQLSSRQDQEVNTPVDSYETGLSVRRLDVWVDEWRLRMRMMSVCVEGARGSHGGALVNLIHGYTDNGDPFIRKFTDELLQEVSRPFFAMLHKWLFFGELYDPFEEFFVSVDSNLGHVAFVHPSSISGAINSSSNDGGLGGSFHDNDDFFGFRTDGQKLWEAKYRFRMEMLPAFVGESFGKKIFSTGKSLNFIRYNCLDSEWVLTREKMTHSGGTLQYGDIAGLERSIDIAYQVASHRLFEVFIDKFKLLDHLSALKNFLLLSHGDFADQLMEILGPSLGKPANSLFRHNLTANLETAIRSSSIQQDPTEVLRRLDARILEYSHGEIGWDVFTLEYKVDPPIDTVLDLEASEKYLKLFKHLWKIKRIEKVLDKAWLKVIGGARIFLRLRELNCEWHRVRLVLAEMIHFIRQLEAYCRLEVIECSWNVLTDFLHKKEGDLDAMIEAHRNFLDRVTRKILLWSSKQGKQELLLRQLMEIFTCVLQFREALDAFFNYCLAESARRDQQLDAVRGTYTAATNNEDPNILPDILERLKEYGSNFSERVQSLVTQLQGHTDLDGRFLAIRLSFSDFYRSKKDQLSSHQSTKA